MTKKYPKRANGGNASAEKLHRDPEAMQRWKEAVAVGRKKYHQRVKDALEMTKGLDMLNG